MDPNSIWNFLLTVVMAVVAFVLRDKFSEIQRLSILLNKTREEIARDHITRNEFRADMQSLMERFDRIESKIDKLRDGNQQ